jgi:phage gp46-like protein
MTDIKIRWDEVLEAGDFLFSDNDLEADSGISTAVYMSIFTDQRAATDDPVPNQSEGYFNRRGWWGDVVNLETGRDQVGSKLWLLDRSKNTDDVLVSAEQYVRDALEWMIEDEIATDITVAVQEYSEDKGAILTFQVSIEREQGETLYYSFEQSGVPLFFPDAEE